MKPPFSTFFLITFLLVFFSCKEHKPDEERSRIASNQNPKNVILLIGDGMGLSHVSIGNFYKEGKSNFERFPVIGLSKNSSETDLITDSAAAATAFASGIKTFHQAIGVDKDSIAVPTIIEQLEVRNFTTGLVVTRSVVHATPAAFYAHVPYRYDYKDIAPFLVDSKIDFIAGGGVKYFRKEFTGKDLFSEFANKGYQIDTTNVLSDATEKKRLILLAEDDMIWKTQGRGSYLSNTAQMAISHLNKSENGFFLMVEGSLIDSASHDGEVQFLIDEQLDFDETIGEVLDFAARDKETLVIVTADHETGDFALSMKDHDYNQIQPRLYSGDHSATMVPVFAFGPGSENFGGVYENTEIYHRIMELLDQ